MIGLVLALATAQTPLEPAPEEPMGWRPQVWVPVTLGASLGAEGGASKTFAFAAGVRPTVVFGRGTQWATEWPRFGLWSELGTAQKDVHTGGGLSVSPLEFLTFEAGVDARRSKAFDWSPELVGSAFLGLRSDVGWCGASLGLRVDGRLGLGASREAMIVASLEFDPLGLVAGIVLVENLVSSFFPKQ